MTTAFYTHPQCRLHDMGSEHPECPQRLDAISDHLRATGCTLPAGATPDEIRSHALAEHPDAVVATTAPSSAT